MENSTTYSWFLYNVPYAILRVMKFICYAYDILLKLYKDDRVELESWYWQII